MSTLRANTLKPITSGNSLILQGDSGGSGVSGPSIDSSGNVDFTQNTDAKIKLPSAGGIYESDGSTQILTESSGSVDLRNINNIYQTTLIIPGSDWDSDVTGTTETTIGAYVAFQNKKASSTVFLEISAFTAQSASGGSTSIRYGRYNIYKSLSTVAAGATSSFGTKIANYIVGRTTATTTSNANKGFQASHFVTSFTSESSAGTNHYIGMTTNADGSNTRVQFISSAVGTGDNITPALIRITEVA